MARLDQADLWTKRGVLLGCIDKDSWYRYGLMVLTPMVLTQTHGIELVLLIHTHTRGPSVTHMRFFNGLSECLLGLSSLVNKRLGAKVLTVPVFLTISYLVHSGISNTSSMMERRTICTFLLVSRT